MSFTSLLNRVRPLIRRAEIAGGGVKGKHTMENIKIDKVDYWYANFVATRGSQFSYGETEQEAVDNLLALEISNATFE